MQGIDAVSYNISGYPSSSGDVFVDLEGDINYNRPSPRTDDISVAIDAWTRASGSSGNVELSHKGNVNFTLGLPSAINLNSTKGEAQRGGVISSGAVTVHLEGDHVYTRNEDISYEASGIEAASELYRSYIPWWERELPESERTPDSTATGGPVTVNFKGSLTSSGSNTRGLTAATKAARDANLGDVSVAIVGDVSTSGANSKALEFTSTTESGQAGNILFDLEGDLTATGAGSRGVAAKSEVILKHWEIPSSNPDLSLSGNASDVDVKIKGDVIASGDSSLAIEAISSTLNGNSGAVTVELAGDLSASGVASSGIAARSSAAAGGNSGHVDLLLGGDVLATSHQAKAVVAESSAPAGTAGNISVVLAPGSTIQTNASGTAVQMIGGASNRLINRGRISARGPSSAALAPVIKAASVATASSTEDASANGFAIVSTTGNDTIINAPGGVIEGTVNLGSGVNQLENQAGAQLISSGELYVGPTAQSVFRNAGVLLSAADQPAVYNLSGSYVQTASGEIRPELDFATLSMDVIDVAFDATLAGTVDLSTTNPELIRPGYYQVPLVRAGSVVNDGLRLEVDSSAIARYSLGFSRTAATVDLDVNFAGFGALNDNQESIGRYLNRVQKKGSSPELAGLIADLYALPALGDERNLGSAYNTLSPEVYTTSFTSLQFAVEDYIDAMMTCPQTDVESGFIAEGECVWAVSQGSYYNSDGGPDYFGFDSYTGGMHFGAQFDLGNDFYVGISGGRNSYSTSLTSAPGKTSRVTAGSTGHSWQGGVVLKKLIAKTKLALGVAKGKAYFDVYRNNLFSSSASASGEQEIEFLGVEMRADHDIDLGPSTYLRPGISLAFQKMHQPSFSETGAGALGLGVNGMYKESIVLNPSIELGHQFKINSVILRPMVRLGYTGYYDKDSDNMSSAFHGAPSVSPFSIDGSNDQNYFNASAGLDVIFGNGMSLSLGYDSQYSSSSQLQGAEVKFTIPF